MKPLYRSVVIGLSLCLSPLWVSASVVWAPVNGGSYEWQTTANWQGGVLPGVNDQADLRKTGMTGDQTIHLAVPVTLNAFYPGASDDTPFSQTFTGAAITASVLFRVMGGNVTLENSIFINGGSCPVGYILPAASLSLRKTGLLSTTNAATLSLGNRYNATYSGAGSLFVEDDAVLRMRGTTNNWTGGLTIGAASDKPGRVWQSGGLVDLESLWIVGPSCDGYYRLAGGQLHLPQTPFGQAHRIGNGGAVSTYGLLHMSGGTLDLPLVSGGSGELNVGSQTITAATPAYSEVYLSGGLLSSPDRALILANWSPTVTTVAHQATFTVDGDANVQGRNIALGTTLPSAAVRATLNLNGGLLSLNYYLSRFGGGKNQAYLNFNGGTVQWRAWPYANSPISGISNITVYSKGGTLDTGALTIPTDISFRTAKGFGVSQIVLQNPGSGFVAAPRISITGGSGSNATAVAVMTKTGTVERVVVTCPGEGYAESDSLTVSFIATAGYGSNAQAGVVLAENTAGTFTKMGSGTWQVTQPNTYEGIVKLSDGYLSLLDEGRFPSLGVLKLTGGTFVSYSNRNDRINPAAVLELGGEGYGPVFRSVRPDEGLTNSQHFAGLAAVPGGLSLIESTGASGVSEVLVGSYSRRGSLVSFTPTPSNRVWFAPAVLTDGSAISPSTVSPVVAGMISADGLNLLERDPASGYLQTATLSGSAAADSNFLVPTGVSTVSVAEANSVVFDDTAANAEFYFGTNGVAQIRSGMILSRSRTNAVKRVGTLTGGTLTTEVPGGLIIYDRENNDRREVIGYGGRLIVSTTLTDPAPGTPMAVTLAGGRFITPSGGALVRFTQTNTFSGNLYLINGGVWFDGDAMLGVATGRVVAAGLCALRPAGSLLETGEQRNIEILPNSALQLLGTAGDSQLASRIRGPLSGGGALLTGEYMGTGQKTVAELTGDNSGFTGAYYVLGALRAQEGVGLSTNANIRFADATDGFGTLDMSGSFTRPLGDGVGQVCWKQYPVTGFAGLHGGFSAYGGPLTVNLHGDGRTIDWGSAYLPATSVLYLQNRLATHDLTFMNGINLRGYQTPHVRVSTDVEKTVHFKGVISDSVGGGTLTKGGNGVLVLESSPTFNGKLAIISGKIRLAEGVSLDTLSEVSIMADGKALELAGTQAMQQVACKITGTGSLTVSDGGTTVLGGANSYTGVTTVASGSTLLVNGTHLGGGDYAVTGTLGGTGTIATAAGYKITLGTGARLSPAGPGVIGTLMLGTPATNSTVELSGATLDVDLSAVSADKVVVTGDLSVGGDSTVNILTLDENLLKSLRGTAITVCQWTGTKVGSFVKNTNVQHWSVVEDLVAKTISLVYFSPGTLVSLQ